MYKCKTKYDVIIVKEYSKEYKRLMRMLLPNEIGVMAYIGDGLVMIEYPMAMTDRMAVHFMKNVIVVSGKKVAY
jgi:hypothetical protein